MREHPARRAASITHEIAGRPPTRCSTLGNRERMRTPLPAASTIATRLSPSVGDGALLLEGALDTGDPVGRPLGVEGVEPGVPAQNAKVGIVKRVHAVLRVELDRLLQKLYGFV